MISWTTCLFLGGRVGLENLKGSLAQILSSVSLMHSLSSNLGSSGLDVETGDTESAKAIG